MLYCSGNLCDTAVPVIITLYWCNKMPRKIKTCEDTVKGLIPWHQKCCTKGRHNPSFYSGCVLSKFLSISGKLDDTREYRVCAGVHNKIRDSISSSNDLDINEEEDNNTNLASSDERLEININEEEENIPLPSPKSRMNHSSKVIDNIIKGSVRFKKSYRDLSMRERDRRVQTFAELVIGSCANKSKLKDHGQGYLHHDTDLCIDTVTFLDALRDRLEKELLTNFKTEVDGKNDLTPRPCVDKGQGDDGDICVSMPASDLGWNREDYSGDSRQYKTAVAMLCEATLSGFSKIRHSIINEFSIPKEWLPSFYLLTKNRPKIESSIIVPKFSSANDNANQFDIEDTTLPAAQLIPTTVAEKKYNLTSFIGDEGMTIATAINLIDSTKDKEIPIARIDGVYEDYLLLMAKQHTDKGRPLKGSVVVLDSYDGAQHKQTDKGNVSIISFSSKLLTAASIKSGCDAGSSLSILTWQQMKGDEKIENLLPAVQNIFENKKSMREEQLMSTLITDSSICVYKLHDGKMLYLLTQHTLFNRKHTPFLWCT